MRNLVSTWGSNVLKVYTKDGGIYEGILTYDGERTINLKCLDDFIVCIPRDMIDLTLQTDTVIIEN